MITKFKNRVSELRFLEGLYLQQKPKLVVLYGRRRVGKTALLMEFSRESKALYLIARQETAADQLKKLSDDISQFFHDDVLQATPFQNYDGLFRYLLQKEVPVIFDEFPYLVQATPSLPSILQEYWDQFFSKKNTFLILCGSSISMMESLLGHASPLYGRRTEQMLLEPLNFWDTQLFFPSLPSEKQVVLYSLLGGTPAYLLEFDSSLNIEENIRMKILQKNTFLGQDTQFVLQQELTEPRTYYSIITAIAWGNTKIGEIMNKTGLEKGIVSKYIDTLQRLHIIERRVPVTEKHSEKSRKGIYVLKDNYFRFWFRFVFEYQQYIEQGKQDLLLKEKIMPQLPAFIGTVYEEVALAWARKTFSDFLIGRWWDKDKEIDLVGISEAKREVIFGEVKWRDVGEREAESILQQLREKSAYVPLSYKKKSYLLVAKTIKGKERLKKKGYLLYDLKDLSQRKK